MTKYLAAVIAALVLALAGAGWTLKRQIAKNGEQTVIIQEYERTVKALREQEQKDRVLIAKRARENAAAAAETARLRSRLEDALARNREWADAPIPKEVQDAMR